MKKNKADIEQLEDVLIELYKNRPEDVNVFIDALIEYRDSCIVEGIEEDRNRSFKLMNNFMKAFPKGVR